jgi:SPP1 gp7 family putative phage head morphogenesis protein
VASLEHAIRIHAAMSGGPRKRAKPPKVPRARFPTNVRLQYYQALMRMVQAVQGLVVRDLLPKLPSILDAHAVTRPARRDAAGNSSQPRVPAGSPEGGEFASSKAGGGGGIGQHPYTPEKVQGIQSANFRDLPLRAHLMPEARHAFLVSQGVKPEAAVAMDRLLDQHSGNHAQQAHALKAIDEHLANNTDVAHALRAESHLEGSAYELWKSGAGVRAEALERHIAKTKHEYNSSSDEARYIEHTHEASDWDDVESTIRGEHARANNPMLYRGGVRDGRTVESWTRLPGGAIANPLSGGDVKFGVKHKATVEELATQGYSILGGLVRGMGAPGESEVTLIRLARPRTDAAGDDIDSAFEQLHAEAEAVIPDTMIEMEAQKNALRVTAFQGAELSKQVQQVAKINLFDNTAGLAAHLDLFVSDNVRLVKSLALDQLDDLKGVVTRGARQGLHHSVIAEQIQQRFGVTQRRAALIATDQVGKLNGELNQVRQQNLGLRRYRWSSSQDERVRPGHRLLNGTIQSWDKPPVVDQRTGERGHPGQPVRCRCQAIPIIDDVLADAGLIDPEDVELGQPAPSKAASIPRAAPEVVKETVIAPVPAVVEPAEDLPRVPAELPAPAPANQPAAPTRVASAGPIAARNSAAMRASLERAMAPNETSVLALLSSVDATLAYQAFGWTDEWLLTSTDTLAEAARTGMHEAGHFLQAQYEATQALLRRRLPELQRRGIVDRDGYVTLYRGLRYSQGKKTAAALDERGVADLRVRATSSWTESHTTARAFAGGDKGVVVEHRVHYTRAIAHYFSESVSWHQNNEFEWTLVSDDNNFIVRRADESVADPHKGEHQP